MMRGSPWSLSSCVRDKNEFLFVTDSDSRNESPYNHIYGRFPVPTRGVIPPPTPRAMYIGEWD